MTDKVSLTRQEYEKMQRDIAKLNALEAGGVDNWEWFSESLKDWQKENELDELIDTTIDELNDILTEADVDQPAGTGCGYSISFDSDMVKGMLLGLIKKYGELGND